jgi:hypothetical protein
MELAVAGKISRLYILGRPMALGFVPQQQQPSPPPPKKLPICIRLELELDEGSTKPLKVLHHF